MLNFFIGFAWRDIFPKLIAIDLVQNCKSKQMI